MIESITALDPLPSDPNVIRVRVDGKIVARLPRTDVDALELAIGQRWTATLADRVDRAIRVNKARKAALGILGRRAMSRRELTDRLAHKDHEPQTAQAIADELEADGWLDDAAYAESIAHELTRTKPASHSLLVQKITARGVDKATAEHVVRGVLADTDPADAALALARKRLKAMTSVPHSTAARRIAGTLTRRGFDEDTVHTVIECLGLHTDD